MSWIVVDECRHLTPILGKPYTLRNVLLLRIEPNTVQSRIVESRTLISEVKHQGSALAIDSVKPAIKQFGKEGGREKAKVERSLSLTRRIGKILANVNSIFWNLVHAPGAVDYIQQIGIFNGGFQPHHERLLHFRFHKGEPIGSREFFIDLLQFALIALEGTNDKFGVSKIALDDVLPGIGGPANGEQRDGE